MHKQTLIKDDMEDFNDHFSYSNHLLIIFLPIDTLPKLVFYWRQSLSVFLEVCSCEVLLFVSESGRWKRKLWEPLLVNTRETCAVLMWEGDAKYEEVCDMKNIPPLRPFCCTMLLRREDEEDDVRTWDFSSILWRGHFITLSYSGYQQKQFRKWRIWGGQQNVTKAKFSHFAPVFIFDDILLPSKIPTFFTDKLSIKRPSYGFWNFCTTLTADFF